MTDTREDILERLRDIAAAVDGVTYAVRNVLDITESRLPAVVILEGDEEPSSAVEVDRRRKPQSPIPMVMTPELCIVAMNASEQVGTDLNQIRAGIIKAITEDTQLQTIIGNNGAIAYRGLASDLGLGRAMLGRMALRFAITYIVFPDRL